MALLVENEVSEPKQLTTGVGLMVGEQVDVKNQVLKIVGMAMVMVMVEAILW